MLQTNEENLYRFERQFKNNDSITVKGKRRLKEKN